MLSGWLQSPLLAVRLNEWLSQGRVPAAAQPLFLHLQHHAQAYSIAVAGGELLFGAALLVGLWARGAALLGLVVSSLPLFLLAEPAPVLAAVRSGHLALSLFQPGPELVMFAALLTLGLCPSGRVLGLDGFLRARLKAPMKAHMTG